MKRNAALIFIAIITGGCNQRIRDCNTLIAAAAPPTTIANMRRDPPAVGLTEIVADAYQMADRLDAITNAFDGFKVIDSDIESGIKTYQNSLRNAAAHAREYAVAVPSGRSSVIDQARSAFEESYMSAQAAADGLRGTCAAAAAPR